MALAALELDFDFDDASNATTRAAADELAFPVIQQITPRQRYLEWVEDQIEEFKCGLRRDELLEIADEAVTGLIDAPDGQYALTEILVCDAVDRLIFRRLKLPTFKRWQRMYQNDTGDRPQSETPDAPTTAPDSV